MSEWLSQECYWGSTTLDMVAVHQRISIFVDVVDKVEVGIDVLNPDCADELQFFGVVILCWKRQFAQELIDATLAVFGQSLDRVFS